MICTVWALTGMNRRMTLLIGNLRKQRGFSLIEMMVVLAIIALVVGMSLPYFGRFTGGTALRASTRQISSLIYTARSLAITQRKPYAIIFDVQEGDVRVRDAGSLELAEKQYHLPATVSLEHPEGADPVSFKDDRIVFTPTGGVSGETGTLWLKDKKGNTAKITVHQSTGRIKVELDKK